MPVPTKTQAKTWQVGPLYAQALEWEQASTSVETATKSVVRDYAGSTGYWSGTLGDTARDDAASIGSEIQRLLDVLDAGATTARTGAAEIARAQYVAVAAIDAAELRTFTVAENGAVTAPDAARLLPGASAEDVVTAQASLDNEASEHEVKIRSALATLGTAEQDASKAIKSAFNDLPSVDRAGTEFKFVDRKTKKPDDTELTAEQGEKDGHTVADGKLSDEEAERIANNLARAGLTPEELAALERGEFATLPASTLAYLEKFYNEAGRDGLLEVSEKLRKDGSPDALKFRENLANGLLTVSNENVVSKERNSSGAPVSRGSWEKLDSEVRELVSTRPNFDNEVFGYNGAPDANTRDLPDDYRGFPENETGAWYEDMGRFSDLLSSSNPDYQPGAKFGFELERQGAHQAWILDNKDLDIGLDPQRGWHNLVEHNAERLLDVGSRNLEASQALLTGTDTAHVDVEKGFQRDKVFMPLFNHEWADEGAALRGVYDWIADDAKVENLTDPGDVSRAENAGKSAYALSQILADSHNYGNLMNMPHSGDESLGYVNPLAVQGLSDALSPYVGNIAGVAPEHLVTRGFGVLENDAASSLFTVIDTDPEAAKKFNGNAYATIAELEGRFATSVLANPQDAAFELGNPAGRIQGYIEAGYTAEAAERGADAEAQKEARQKAFDFAVESGETALSAVPGIDYVEPLIGIFTGSLEDTIVGDADHAIPRDEVAANHADAIQTYNIVRALEAQNQLVPSPLLDAYRGPDGLLLPYDDAIQANNPLQDPRTGSDQVGAAALNYLRSQNFPTIEFLASIRAGRDDVLRP